MNKRKIIHMASGGISGFGPNPIMEGYAICNQFKSRCELNFKDVTCKKCIKKGQKNLLKYLEQTWGSKVKVRFV